MTTTETTETTETAEHDRDQAFSYSHDDDGLLDQPIGYWSWAANKAVIDYIRAGLQEVELTQPQWWVLNQVRDGNRRRDEVFTLLRNYLDVGEALNGAIDDLIGRGLVATENAPEGGDGEGEALLSLTESGAERLDRATERQLKSLARIREGVSDADFLTTMKVLQRMIHNTDGKAWHH
ncbi:MarR family winged helix-turn-helix transcriptional regulator [Streptomyces boluensis]|uniref:Winged helix DNA-binding protein n=1 Tax=Streptomyces boluensis TaxID=1775135 RepID=A0A964UY07_9ACTN|nr:MarR family winged helix-turn-helix transcriptional regulator [Streptomyces boluensis]NBE56315.1 winged helix DNA-binding protein [Streptomyces boluensis]